MMKDRRVAKKKPGADTEKRPRSSPEPHFTLQSQRVASTFHITTKKRKGTAPLGLVIANQSPSMEP